ncbi:PIN domain-containing protein [Methanolacinia paynteri]|uniref:PIN domain-containing protein n=1 Tax=Methanolacinia paynteri TaxID=230356 RepID=UPI00064EAB46|nr:PIN domain-containing protein [Methanolacinia paynteri]
MKAQLKKKIYIFVDTNHIYNTKNDLDLFSTKFLNYLLRLKNFFSAEIGQVEIEIIFPDTVVKERIQQKFDQIFPLINSSIACIDKLCKYNSIDETELIKNMNILKENLKGNLDKIASDFLIAEDIQRTSTCSGDNFNKIIEKAIKKEVPFNTDKSRGLKDALIWYSIQDYIDSKDISSEDQFFFFTENIKDFNSQDNKKEFIDKFKKELQYVNLKNANFENHDEKIKNFLVNIITNFKEYEITSFRIIYSEYNSFIKIFEVFAKPLPFNFAPMIRKKYSKNNWEDEIKSDLINEMKNFNFKGKWDDIKLETLETSPIERIIVELDYSRSMQSYILADIEIELYDSTSKYPHFENIIIPEECVHYHLSPDNRNIYEYYTLDPEYLQQIISYIENEMDLEIESDLIDIYTD